MGKNYPCSLLRCDIADFGVYPMLLKTRIIDDAVGANSFEKLVLILSIYPLS